MSVATGQTAERAVFARKTSGLVKELGAFESFSINLISLGPGPAYGLFLIILLFVTGANLMQATLLAALVANTSTPPECCIPISGSSEECRES
jgi:hypothetical protein